MHLAEGDSHSAIAGPHDITDLSQEDQYHENKKPDSNDHAERNNKGRRLVRRSHSGKVWVWHMSAFYFVELFVSGFCGRTCLSGKIISAPWLWPPTTRGGLPSHFSTASN